MGSIPNTDRKFLDWCGYQTQKRGALEMMKLYVNQLNVESHMLYEQQLSEYERQKKEHTGLIIKATNADDLPAAELLESSLNNPNSQIIPSPNSQNIPLPEAQEQSTPLIPEHPSQNSPVLSPPSTVPATAPRTEQSLDANNLTMSQALELFELMQARRATEVVRPPTIEAQHVELAPRRAEPLSFMTLQTVERIIESSDLDADQGQNSWEAKTNKFVGLGHAYSSVNTVSGETCYMIDGQLYQNILLAVAAKKQYLQAKT